MRFFDIIFSFILIIFFSPILILVSAIIFFQDFKSPLYIAERVGLKFKVFKMHKFRTMVVNADKSGVFSTSINDHRVTKLGHILRRFKLDELPQLFNVLTGTMSFVGPRPNVKIEVDKYNNEKKNILDVRPGITDFSSIVFSDEGKILQNSKDPDHDYNILIRPWKSRLGLFYIKHKSLILNIIIIFFTIISIFNRLLSLELLSNYLRKLGAENDLVEISLRKIELTH